MAHTYSKYAKLKAKTIKLVQLIETKSTQEKKTKKIRNNQIRYIIESNIEIKYSKPNPAKLKEKIIKIIQLLSYLNQRIHLNKKKIKKITKYQGLKRAYNCQNKTLGIKNSYNN